MEDNLGFSKVYTFHHTRLSKISINRIIYMATGRIQACVKKQEIALLPFVGSNNYYVIFISLYRSDVVYNLWKNN